MNISDLYDGLELKSWEKYKEKGFTMNDKLRWIGNIMAIPEDLKHQPAVNRTNVNIQINKEHVPLEGASKQNLKKRISKESLC
jgi:hypothetical protein